MKKEQFYHDWAKAKNERYFQEEIWKIFVKHGEDERQEGAKEAHSLKKCFGSLLARLKRRKKPEMYPGTGYYIDKGKETEVPLREESGTNFFLE